MRKTARERAAERLARLELAGIPDSRPFIDPNATGQNAHLMDCHVGGMPFSELPVALQANLSWDHTDEAIAERNAGKVVSAARANPVGHVGRKLTATEFDQQVAERGDQIEGGLQPWQAADPMRELVDSHVAPGFSGKFLSQRVINGVRGKRGFEVVRDAKGDPIKMGNMLLGQMPKAHVEQRNKYYRDKSREHVEVHQETMTEEQARQERDSGGVVRGLQSKSTVTGRGFTRHGEAAYTPTAEIGLRTVRGNQT